jgi:hypothetical protein
VISLVDKLRPKLSTTDANLMLNIEVDQLNQSIESILTAIEAIAPDANIRRIDQDNETLAVTALVKIKDSTTINQFSTDFREKFPSGRFSFIDDSSMPNE